MTFLEKWGIVIMFGAISISLGYPNSEVIVGIARPILMLIGSTLFVVGGKDDSKN